MVAFRAGCFKSERNVKYVSQKFLILNKNFSFVPQRATGAFLVCLLQLCPAEPVGMFCPVKNKNKVRYLHFIVGGPQCVFCGI